MRKTCVIANVEFARWRPHFSAVLERILDAALQSILRSKTKDPQQ